MPSPFNKSKKTFGVLSLIDTSVAFFNPFRGAPTPQYLGALFHTPELKKEQASFLTNYMLSVANHKGGFVLTTDGHAPDHKFFFSSQMDILEERIKLVKGESWRDENKKTAASFDTLKTEIAKAKKQDKKSGNNKQYALTAVLEKPEWGSFLGLEFDGGATTAVQTPLVILDKDNPHIDGKPNVIGVKVLGKTDPGTGALVDENDYKIFAASMDKDGNINLGADISSESQKVELSDRKIEDSLEARSFINMWPPHSFGKNLLSPTELDTELLQSHRANLKKEMGSRVYNRLVRKIEKGVEVSDKQYALYMGNMAALIAISTGFKVDTTGRTKLTQEDRIALLGQAFNDQLEKAEDREEGASPTSVRKTKDQDPSHTIATYQSTNGEKTVNAIVIPDDITMMSKAQNNYKESYSPYFGEHDGLVQNAVESGIGAHWEEIKGEDFSLSKNTYRPKINGIASDYCALTTEMDAMKFIYPALAVLKNMHKQGVEVDENVIKEVTDALEKIISERAKKPEGIDAARAYISPKDIIGKLQESNKEKYGSLKPEKFAKLKVDTQFSKDAMMKIASPKEASIGELRAVAKACGCKVSIPKERYLSRIAKVAPANELTNADKLRAVGGRFTGASIGQ